MVQSNKSNNNDLEKNKDITRRKALKTIAAVTGAATLSALPTKWVHPHVKGGVLPAFAQTSPPPSQGPGDLQVILTWDTGDATCLGEEVDIDLHIVEPDGTRVYFGNRVGPTARLDIDNICGIGPENASVAANSAAAGIYRVQVVYYLGTPTTTATIQIKTLADTPQEQTATFTRLLSVADTTKMVSVADIAFPGGTIIERIDMITVTDSLLTKK
ncbi:MAG: twin-arginine translocation signal domain-containing protein [Chloroflexi bacterium]|nr:twin-arginine translocation signal domain-containing protein [Chloroflexota bacterium]